MVGGSALGLATRFGFTQSLFQLVLLVGADGHCVMVDASVVRINRWNHFDHPDLEVVFLP